MSLWSSFLAGMGSVLNLFPERPVDDDGQEDETAARFPDRRPVARSKEEEKR